MSFEALWADHWLPRAPLASSSKSGTYRRTTRKRALTLPYVEANPLVLRSLVVTDHDGADADLVAGFAGLPAPSYVALNPRTRAGHVVYALAAPVCLTAVGSRRPVNLLARIEQGLCTVLGGDVAYGGRITKNPHHVQDHLALWGPAEAVYGLRELAQALEDVGALPGAGNPRRNVTSSGVGRNVALFDHTRRWAYRRRGDFDRQSDWERAVFGAAWAHNETVIADEFTRGPLSATEAGHVAQSIARWTWRKIQRTFAEEQARRGRAGGAAGTGASKRRDALITMNKARRIDRAAAWEVVTGGR